MTSSKNIFFSGFDLKREFSLDATLKILFFFFILVLILSDEIFYVLH